MTYPLLATRMPAPLRRTREDIEGDDRLMARVGEGDLSALGVLYDRHHQGVRAFVLRATGGAADADDVTQEAFLTLSRIADRYDGRSSARPLLLGIAARLIHRRKRGLARWARALAGVASLVAPAAPTPEDAASASEEMRRFDAALATLSEDKRITLLLVEREGLTGPEVARILDVPVNTVWTRLHYARAELRRALAAL
jgi:RNA polymerase sigma-70 factor (ECF subfamily)